MVLHAFLYNPSCDTNAPTTIVSCHNNSNVRRQGVWIFSIKKVKPCFVSSDFPILYYLVFSSDVDISTKLLSIRRINATTPVPPSSTSSPSLKTNPPKVEIPNIDLLRNRRFVPATELLDPSPCVSSHQFYLIRSKRSSNLRIRQ